MKKGREESPPINIQEFNKSLLGALLYRAVKIKTGYIVYC